jgi:hypothetical protein
MINGTTLSTGTYILVELTDEEPTAWLESDTYMEIER